MKIAFIGQKGIPAKQGGIEKHVEQLSAKLVERGFDITVYSRPNYTGNHNYKYKQNGINIISLPSVPTKHLDAISHTFIATIHSLFQDYDIIHYHGVGPALLSFIPRLLKPKAKVVVTFHCIDRVHQKWGRLAKLSLYLGEKAACRFPHETIVISQTLEKYAKFDHKHQARYIPNGVAIDQIADAKKAKYLAANGLIEGEYIVAVSRLIRHKGIHTLIKAYSSVATDKKLVIVGDGAHTDDYVKELHQQAQGNPNIVFLGAKSGYELAAIFSSAHLFIQPSEAEGLSIALLEAMAYGVPAIISNIEENQEAAESLALEFVNKSAADLSRKIRYALDNPDVMAAFAARAQKRALSEYDWDKIARETALAYHDLAGHLALSHTK